MVPFPADFLRPRSILPHEEECHSWFHRVFWGDKKAKTKRTNFFGPVSKREKTTTYRCKKCEKVTARFTHFSLGKFSI